MRRSLASAARTLREHGGTAAGIAIASAVGLAAAIPVASFARLSNLLPLIALLSPPVPQFGVSWSELAQTPGAVRDDGVATLFHLLALIAIGALIVTALTAISLGVVRATVRTEEMSVQRAVGASRRHLVRATLIESLAIGLVAVVAGGIFGLPVARWFKAAWPGPVEGSAVAALAATLLAIAGLVLLSTSLPLLGIGRKRLLAAPTAKPLELIVAAFQLGVSLTVLGATTLLSRGTTQTENRIQAAGPGGQVFEVAAAGTDAERAATYASLLRGLHADSDSRASLTSPGTLSGLGVRDFAVTDCGACVMGGLPFPLHPVMIAYHAATADTFGMMGARVLSGRGFRDEDGWSAPRVAVVSYSLAARHYERSGAVGRLIQVGEGVGNWYKVVGVVEDGPRIAFGSGLHSPNAVYLSALQHPPRAGQLLVRPGGGAALDRVKAALAAAPGLTAGASASEAAITAKEAMPVRWFGWIIGLEGWVTLVVAVAGMFALMHLWVRSLQHEIGVRRAVGANRYRVLGFVLARGAGVVIGGVAFALWLGIIVWGTLAVVVPGLPDWDASVVVGYVPLLAGAALIGALVPTWRAVKAKPAEMLAA